MVSVLGLLGCTVSPASITASVFLFHLLAVDILDREILYILKK